MAEAASPALLDEVRERLEAFLGRGGHRKTPERFSVLEEIYIQGGHFDVDALLRTHETAWSKGQPRDFVQHH